MGNPSAAPPSQEPPAASSSDRPTTPVPGDRSTPFTPIVMSFLETVGLSKNPIAENYSSEDFYSDLLCNHLKVDTVRRGHISCFTTVKPTISNFYGALHGSAVAAIAERVAIATARTVVGEDKDMFLGELATSYLSAAAIDEELIVEGYVVRSGRNLTAIVVDFKTRKTGKLVYSSRATFYNSPIAKL